MAEQLSQDLPAIDTIDILWDSEETINTDLDIIPDTEKVVTEEVVTEDPLETLLKETPKEEPKVEAKEEPKVEVKEWVDPLDSLLGEVKGIDKEVNAAIDKTAEIKETVEEVKSAISEDDTNWAEKLIDTLYKQVIEYSTSVDTLSAKNDVLQSKLIELTNANSDFELEFAQNARNSNDPKMIILNRMYDEAASAWEWTAKTKVVSTLEDMYYWLTWKSFDDTRIEKVSDENAEEVVLNELTAPEIKPEPKEEIDLNDITSIF